MGKWISVKDKMPQEPGESCINVILFMDNGEVTIGWLNQIRDKGYYLDESDDIVAEVPLSRFTHWMSLPESPVKDKVMGE